MIQGEPANNASKAKEINERKKKKECRKLKEAEYDPSYSEEQT